MTNDTLYTHQIPRACKECKPYLLKQYPFLNEYLKGVDDINRENVQVKLSEYEMNWGKELSIEPIPQDDHTRKDACKEVEEIIGKDKVIRIENNSI